MFTIKYWNTKLLNFIRIVKWGSLHFIIDLLLNHDLYQYWSFESRMFYDIKIKFRNFLVECLNLSIVGLSSKLCVSCWYSFFTEFWIFSESMNLKSVVGCCFLFCLVVVFITSDWSPEQQLSRGPGAELVASAKWDVVLCGRRQTDHVDTKCDCRVYPAAPG